MKIIAVWIMWGACTMIASGQTNQTKEYHSAKIFQTSKSGDKLTPKGAFFLTRSKSNTASLITLSPEKTFQQIVGFGGAFTQASASVLKKMSPAKRQEVLDAYFRSDKAAYSMMRTHINSCDFSEVEYAYDNTPGDTALKNFSIDRDKDDVIPLIQDAMKCEGANLRIFASPWTAPPWMKDSNAWNTGSLLPEYYSTWALYFSKYLQAYAKEGIKIWGVTVENEPENNSGQWDAMIFTPTSMKEFLKTALIPQFQKDQLDTKILIYDHNMDHVKFWADTLLSDQEVAKHVWGTAVHWYSSTVDWYPDALNYVHEKFTSKEILHTEACIDSEVPHWQDDAWYWSKDAKDWGYTWASAEDKPLHPVYVPVYRYARSIIGGLNSWVTGWVDWNIVLNTQGGPNHVKNWAIAPVIAKPETDEIYFTPLYYVMTQFSKFFRPGGFRIGVTSDIKDLMVTSCKNPDGTIAVAILNQKDDPVEYTLCVGDKYISSKIDGNALQTVVIE